MSNLFSQKIVFFLCLLLAALISLPTYAAIQRCNFDVFAEGATYDNESGIGNVIRIGNKARNLAFRLDTDKQDCDWSVYKRPAWITFSKTSGLGDATLNVFVAANNGAPRTGTIGLANKEYTVIQGNDCAYVVSPADIKLPATSGRLSLRVDTQGTCPWRITKSFSWADFSPFDGAKMGTGTKVLSIPYQANTSSEARTGEAVIAGKTVRVTQEAAKQECTYHLTKGGCVGVGCFYNYGSKESNMTIQVITQQNCAWSASGPSWISFAKSSGSGSGVLYGIVSENKGAERKGNVTVGGSSVTVSQEAAQQCTYEVKAERINSATFNASSGGAGLAFGSGKGNMDIHIKTQDNCPWSAKSPSWITFSNPSGSGSATLYGTINENTGGARTGVVNVGGKTVAVSQEAPCTARVEGTLTNPGSGVLAGAAHGSSLVKTDGTKKSLYLIVDTPKTCSWAVTSKPSWINGTIKGGAGFTILEMTIDENTSGAARSGSVVVNGKAVAVQQEAACTFDVKAQGAMYNSQGNGVVLPYTPLSTSVTLGGGRANLVVQVKTPSSCKWSATSSASWIGLPKTTMSGTTTLNVSIPANAGESRTGTFVIADKTITVTQEGACAFDVKAQGANYDDGGKLALPYTPLSTSVSFNAQKGDVAIQVTTSPSCSWSIANRPGWISASGDGPNKGSKTIHIPVHDNQSGKVRTGTLTIGGKNIAMTQEAACSYDVKAEAANYDEKGKLLPYTPLSTSLDIGNAKADLAVHVKAHPHCAWSFGTSPGWITASTAKYKGNATVHMPIAANTSASSRTGTLNVSSSAGTKPINVTQAGGCTVEVKAQGANYDEKGALVLPYTPLSTSVALKGAKANLQVQVTTPATCSWSVTASPSWMTAPKTQAKGNMTLNIPVAENATVSSRSGVLTINGKNINVTQEGGCSYDVKAQGANLDDKGNLVLPYTPLSTSVSLGGKKANVAIQVKTSSSCMWSVATTPSWIKVSSANNKGNMTLNAAVEANTSAEGRTGKIVVAGKTITVTQQSNCSFEVRAQGAMLKEEGNTVYAVLPYTPISTTTVPFKKERGVLAVYVKASCPWEVTSAPSWIQAPEYKETHPTATATTSLSIHIDANKGDARMGELIVAGKTITVTQESGKCNIGLKVSYANLDSTEHSVELPYKTATVNGSDPNELGAHFASRKGVMSIEIQSNNCPWEVKEYPEWITMGDVNKGTQNIKMDTVVQTNGSTERFGQIIINDKKISITQDKAPAPLEKCEYTFSSKFASLSHEGGNWAVNVMTDPGCKWTATATVPWAKATKNPTGVGSGIVGFTIEPNTGDNRGGLLTIGGKNLPLIQTSAGFDSQQ